MIEVDVSQNGYGSKSNHQATAGFSPCFHLPGVTLLLTYSQVGKPFLDGCTERTVAQPQGLCLTPAPQVWIGLHWAPSEGLSEGVSEGLSARGPGSCHQARKLGTQPSRDATSRMWSKTRNAR